VLVTPGIQSNYDTAESILAMPQLFTTLAEAAAACH